MDQESPDRSHSREDWEDAPLPALLHGIEQFNHREYFECHETLEGIWIKEPGHIRTFYKGILQVGVGCYHLLRNNYRGALIKLDSGARYLEPFAPRCLGVDVARLIADARRLHSALTRLGPDHFREVDLSLLPIISYDAGRESGNSSLANLGHPCFPLPATGTGESRQHQDASQQEA